MICEKLDKISTLCFEPREVKAMLSDCQAKGKTIEQCLSETGWTRFIELLKKHKVL